MSSDPTPPPAEPGADATGIAVRRAPFSDNPTVGARGQRTQQRILDAALEVFGERGYHQTSIDRITKVAGCSRVSFYQYFSSKEDLYRHLTGQVARQLAASTEALGTLTPDLDGWRAIRGWVGRHAEIYDRYEPVFHAFRAAAEIDEAVAGGSARTSQRNVERIRARLATTDLPPRRLDPVIGLLLETLTRTHDMGSVLRAAAGTAFAPDRVDDAIADVVHRTFFGLRPDVNVHPPRRGRAPALPFGPAMGRAIEADDTERDLTPAGRRTLEALVAAGRDVFVERGYHGARVDDIVEAAGVSHGAFYRYFTNKDDLARVVAGRAIRGVGSAFASIPPHLAEDPDQAAALRAWLRTYNAVHAPEAAVIQVWVDAARQDGSLRADSAAALDWGRRRSADLLRPRGFGDPDTEGLVLVALLGAFGARERPPAAADAAAHIIERGLFGR